MLTSLSCCSPVWHPRNCACWLTLVNLSACKFILKKHFQRVGQSLLQSFDILGYEGKKVLIFVIKAAFFKLSEAASDGVRNPL